MTSYSRVHLKDEVLLRDLASHLAQDRTTTTTATLLADIAEVDARKLYVPASYPSMFMYCVHEHHMSEDMAYKRIQAARAARAARRFPALFPALAEGRLHLTAVVLLAPYLSTGTADELIAAACMEPLVPEPVVPSAAPNSMEQVVPLATPPAPRPRIAPSSPGRFTLQLTMGQVTHDLLREARPMRGSTNSRHNPAEVQRAVWRRDGGQCAFVFESGWRCEERTSLEFDHVEPVARGGRSTVAGVRLICRAHNQYAAELVYGTEFMAGKREQGQEQAARAKANPDAKANAGATTNAEAKANAEARARAAAEAASQQEVIPWLRALGCRAEEARRAAARCAGMVDAALEKRVFVAVQGLGPPGVRRVAPVASSPA